MSKVYSPAKKLSWQRSISVISLSVGSLALMVILLSTVFNVIGRRVGLPIIGVFDITQFFLILVVSANIVYTENLDAHVKIDFVVERLSLSKRTLLRMIVSFVIFIVCILVTWPLISEAKHAYDYGLSYEVLGWPVFVSRGILSFAFLMFAIVEVARFIDLLKQWLRNRRGAS